MVNVVCLIERNELDGLDSADKYPEPFQIVLNLDYKNIESPQASEEVWHHPAELENQLSRATKQLVFQSADEMNQFTKIFGIGIFLVRFCSL